jgi:uncharacterized protein
MKKALLVIFLVFLLSVNIGLSQTNPEIPTLRKYVNDFANVLSDSDRVKIGVLCAEIEDNWTVEVAVLTVNTTQPMSIEEYAVKVFEKNGIGKKDKDNGLLIVAAMQDKKWRFEIGYGLEPIITDSTAGKIGRTYIVPYFQQERYGDGLYNAVDAIAKVIQNSGDDSFISEQGTDENLFIPIFFITVSLLIFFIIVILVLVSFFSNKCLRCGTQMKCNYDEKNDYVVCKCPKCGKVVKKRRKKNFWFFVGGLGSGGGSGGGGGGGGFGGGGSGGGGASGGW